MAPLKRLGPDRSAKDDRGRQRDQGPQGPSTSLGMAGLEGDSDMGVHFRVVAGAEGYPITIGCDVGHSGL